MNEEYSFETSSPSETWKFGRDLGEILRQGDVVFLIGGLGAGKTQMTKGIAGGLSVTNEDQVTSPTFTIINEYAGQLRLYHIDLYRLEDPEELEELGLAEILDGDGVSVVEWPDNFFRQLGEPSVTVRLRRGRRDGSRELELSFTDPGRQKDFLTLAGKWRKYH